VGLWASKATKGQTSGDALQSTLDGVVRSAAAASLSARVHRAANDTGDSTDSQGLLGAPDELGGRVDPNTSVTAPITSIADALEGSVHHVDEIRGHGEEERAHTINVLLAHPVVMRAMQNPRLDAILTHLLGLMLFLNPKPLTPNPRMRIIFVSLPSLPACVLRARIYATAFLP
jgi:hypothetical protein